MIRRVSANSDGFRSVEFSPGFNLVLAERTDDASDRDSRNGLGKSTLLEIIDFCLGSKGTKGRGVVVDGLAGWTFRVDLTADDRPLAFSRSVKEPNWIYVDSNFDDWPVQPTVKESRARMSVAKQRILLGRFLFGLTPEIEEVKFGPTYRSQIAYQIRRGQDAFLDPFTQDRKQNPWDQQVNTAYRLGLNWQDASAFQELRAEKKVIDNLVSAMKGGALPSYLGSEGELEAERVRLQSELARQEERLSKFEVHEDYRQIEQEANSLTEQIHRLINENMRDRRRVDLYSSRLGEEREAVVTGVEVEKLFAEANVALPDQVTKRLAELKAFHDAVIENRTAYLAGEISRLNRAISEREVEIGRRDAGKGERMRVLASTGALEDFTRLQDLHVEAQGRLRDVDARLERLREVVEARAAWDQRSSEVLQAARTRYTELREVRDSAIKYFNSNTEALYEAPGRLIIDVTEKGFEFDVKIDRSDSHGVSNMKIFCFDLTVMQLWAERGGGPGFLIHDSALFDGVDERQVAAALALAKSESERLGFQYICSLNSDDLPRDELGDDHPVLDSVVLELHDHDPSGMLLGVKF